MVNATPRPDRDIDNDGTGRRIAGSPSSMPRWVKVFGIVALALIALAVILLITGGEHGPGRHIPSDARGRLSTVSLSEGRPLPGGQLGGRG
jgi:hypothetical protein